MNAKGHAGPHASLPTPRVPTLPGQVHPPADRCRRESDTGFLVQTESSAADGSWALMFRSSPGQAAGAPATADAGHYQRNGSSANAAQALA
jgi:hypothetical protein